MANEGRSILKGLTEAQRSAVVARLERSVDRSGGPLACHPFTKGKTSGYGALWVPKPDGGRRMVKAHRLAYEASSGQAPPSVDHQCHDHETCPDTKACPHRACCNPDHLLGMTIGENAARARSMRFKDRCSEGHLMTPENTYESPAGARCCRTCAAARAREGREAARADRVPQERKRKYRPRGMSVEQLVEWGTGHNSGDGCWSWRDARINGDGYVGVTIGQKFHLAHRLVYTVHHGPIPDGMHVDHTCHDPATCDGGYSCPHRACVNPDHLKATLPVENSSTARAAHPKPTHCKNEHEFTPENTYTDKRGSRHCRACHAARALEAHHAAREGRPDGRTRVDGICVNEHDTAVTGLTSNGRCAECARESNREWARTQRALNPEKERDKLREYRARNRDAYNAAQRQRRAAKKAEREAAARAANGQ